MQYKYSTNLSINNESIDCLLGTRTRGGRMVGADKSTELHRHPIKGFKVNGGVRNYMASLVTIKKATLT